MLPALWHLGRLLWGDFDEHQHENEQPLSYAADFWKTDPQQFLLQSFFSLFIIAHVHQPARVSQSAAFIIGIHLLMNYRAAGESCYMSAMGCEEGRAAVSRDHCVATCLSTKNAFQRPTVLSETSKPGTRHFRVPGKRGRRLELLRVQALSETALGLNHSFSIHCVSSEAPLGLTLPRKRDWWCPPHRAMVRIKLHLAQFSVDGKFFKFRYRN